ncbi:MAG: helix-turn-helix domain-containing protein [Isosphaeraceae bacterium]|nr:helix-turn-helix domain-containing protein [Isosphaeraceae bacterium]
MEADSQSPVEPLLRPKEVAAWLAISARQLRRIVEAEGLPYRVIHGRLRRFVRSEVQAWLESRKVVRGNVAPHPDSPADGARSGPGAARAPRPAAVAPDWREQLRRIGKGVGTG